MNWPSVLILLGLTAITAAIIITGIRNKKQGKSSCSCGGKCGACPMGCSCHPNK